jgi:hypothetical protein
MNKNYQYIILLIIIFLTTYILINPLGNFLINDEWFYVKAVYNFNFSNFKLDPLITPSLIGQIFYTNILISIFGFSFNLLKITTIFLSIFSSILLYLLFIELSFKKIYAFFVSLIFFFNPLFFYLSFGFMTDVHALFFIILALYLLAKYNNKNKSRYFLFACLSIIYAIIIRQNYIFLLPLSLVFIINKKRFNIKNIFIYIFNLFLLLFLYIFLKSKGWWPFQDINLHSFENKLINFQHIKNQIFSIWHYLGFFLLPLSFTYLLKKKKITLTNYFIIIISFFYSIWHIFYNSNFFPYFKNIINIYGLGPRTPNQVLHGDPSKIINLNSQIILSIIIAISASIILSIFWDIILKFKKKNIPNKIMLIFLILSTFSQVAIILLFLGFDRYYLPIFVFLLLILSHFIDNKKVYLINIFILLIISLGTIFLSKISIEENRVKWQIADNLTSQEIKVDHIDAGYEWLGWNWYGKTPLWRAPYWEEGTPWYISQLFPDNERLYIISHEKIINDYKTKKTYKYFKIFNKNYNLYLHQKNSGLK